MRNRLISAIMLATMVTPLATTAAEARRDDRGERHERNDRRGGDHRNDRHDDRRGSHRNEGSIRHERAPGSRTEVSGRNGGNYQVRNEYVRSRDDDRREYRDDRRNYNRGYRQGYRNGHDGWSSWNRDWRNDRRYDWRHHRDRYRHHYNLGRYFPPVRHHRHSRISIGFYIGAPFYHGRYWIGNPGHYHLPPAYGPYRWVRYYDDILLVNVRNGYVVDVIYDFFW